MLGRIMAPEIGHLILGPGSHSRQGLMRSRWSVAEVRRNFPHDWLMSADDGRRLQQALTARWPSALAANAVPADAR
jgi:hypothetical protein